MMTQSLLNTSDHTFHLKRAAENDAKGIHLAHMRSIQELCSKDDSAEEIAAWSSQPYMEEQRIAAIRNDLVWVVLQNGEIDGSKQGYICGLYLTRKASKKSLGRSILDQMFTELRLAKATEVRLDSSATALAFYQKAGFVSSKPESTLKIGGIPIRCYSILTVTSGFSIAEYQYLQSFRASRTGPDIIPIGRIRPYYSMANYT